MIQELTEDILASFKVASANVPTAKVLKFLANELEAMRIANDDLTGENLTRSQGACKKLDEILTVFKNAHDIKPPSQDDGIAKKSTFY